MRRQKAYDEDLSDTSLLESDDFGGFIDIPDMPPVDSEEVKEGNGLKIWTQNKLMTRLPIILAQIKAGKNSNKLTKEIRQILYLLYQHNKSNKKVYNNLMKLL